MNYKISSLQPILDCFDKKDSLTPSEIAFMLGKSKVIVHKYLKALVEQWIIKKSGSWVHITYSLTKNKKNTVKDIENISFSFSDWEILENSFYKFSENGTLLKGINGFIEWCTSRGLNPQEKLIQFIKIKHHFDSLKDSCWLIETTLDFKKNVAEFYLDSVYFADQYNRMEFGRGKLAELTFFAKQSQNLKLISESNNAVIRQILCLIGREKIEAIALTPHSVVRKNQLLKYLKRLFSANEIPFIRLSKYYPNKIPIPQKTLKTKEQGIQNAEKAIFVDTKNAWEYKKVLLIDDFVGSWATLNITARKLKEAWVKTVVWFAYVGNINLSYEIINEI